MPEFFNLTFVALFTLLPIMGQTVVNYGTVPRSEIERRLNAFEDSDAKREKKLLSLFQESGCSDDLTEQPVKHVKVPNVVCTLPGATDSIILVGGHFDFVNAGKGVVDNWSGSALLPSLYTSLKISPRRHAFLFVGFTDEERGMVGSRFYVDKMGKENLKKISAMVNLDSLGTSPTKVEMDRAPQDLLKDLASVAAALKLPISIMNVHRVGRSDSDSFQDRKVPAISIHSLTQETFPILHSQRDQIGAIHLGDYYETYLLLRAYLPYLDQRLDAPQ